MAPPSSQGIVPGWTWETDAQGRYLFCAPEIRTLLGLDPASLVGQPVADISSASDTSGRRELAAALNSQRPLFDLRLEARTASGALRVVVLNALPLFDPNDQFLGYRGVAHVLLRTGELSSVTHPEAVAPIAPTEPAMPAVEPAAEASLTPAPQLPAVEPAVEVEETPAAPAALAATDTAADETIPPPAILKGTAHLPPLPPRPASEDETPPPPVAKASGVTGPLARRQPPSLRSVPSIADPVEPAAPNVRSPGGVQTVWEYLADATGVAPYSGWTAPEIEAALSSGALVANPPTGSPPVEDSPAAPRAMAIPIRLQDETLGALSFFDQSDSAAWSEDDLALVQAVTDQLALAIENARLFDETRDYLEKQTLLYEVTRAAAGSANLADALNGAATALSRVLPDANIAILLLDPDGRELRIRASIGFPAGLGSQFSVPVGDGITGWVAAHNEPLLLPDVRKDTRYLPGVAGMLSEAAVPLALADRVIGVLNVESPRLNAFDDQDLQLLSTLAGTLSAIIVNNNLLADITRERERLAVLYDVLQSLISRPDRQSIYDTALEMAERIGAQHAYLLLVGDEPDEAAFLSTLPGLDRLDVQSSNHFAQTIAARGLEKWVLATGRPAVVADTRRDQRWLTAPQHTAEQPARSVISVPLTTQRGTLRGVLAYTHSLPGALGEEQLPLIESIAGQVSVALENEQLRHEQRIQGANAQALARAAQALTSTLIESELHQIVVEQIFAAFHPAGVMTLRWEPANHTFIPLAAALGPAETAHDRAAWPAIGQAFAAARRPDLLDILHKREPRLMALRDEPDGRHRQSLVLPLLYGGEVEGVVEMIHTTPMGGLKPSDIELFQSILTAASSALQSARLYELQRQTAERLAEVDRLKSQFLANMSHELRTPLNSIIGFSRVILKGIDGPLSDLQAQDLTSINNAGQHLLGLINDILDMARIEAGKMELVFDEVDLLDTIKGVLSTMVALIKDKPVKLVQDLGSTLPKVRADSMRVRQVLLNLLANAAKFTDQGSITLRARPVDAISPASGLLEPFVEISIIDTGPGISPEDMDKLFEPFSQVDASATRKAGGTGLGLSICRQLVDLHNGRIWAESVEGEGSTFSFILPVGQPELQAPDQPAVPETSTIPMVLAVDDDPGILNLYRRYLEPHGYRFVGVNKSTDAISRAAELRPSAMLLDVMMPNKDGWQVLAELKRSNLTRDIPVIMCTLVSEPRRAAEMGASGYLTKPILETDLVLALKRLQPTALAAGARQVLVIDTNPAAAEFIRGALKLEGAPDCEIVTAEDGAAGLAWARQHRPAAIILDLILPTRDGYEVLAELRDDAATRTIPVLLITGVDLTPRERERLTRQVSTLREKSKLNEEQLLVDLRRALGPVV